MLFLEEISDDFGLPLPAAQVTANARHQLGAAAGTALAQAIGFDVLVEQFIRVELRAVTWQPDQAQARLVGADKLFGDGWELLDYRA